MRHRDEHKQQALMAATLSEVSEHGFAVTSVARIAKSAGMSPGTLYLYYRDKEALLEATFLEVSRRIIEVALEAFDAPSSREALDLTATSEVARGLAGNEAALRAETHQFKSSLGRAWQALVSLGRREPALFRFHDQFLHSSHMRESLKITNQQRASILLDAFEAGKQAGILKQIDLVLIEIFMFRTIYSLLQGEGGQIPPISDESFDQGFEMAWDAVAQRA